MTYILKFSSLLVISVICLMGSSNAQLDRSIRPEPAPAPEIQIGDYESFTLRNGLKVFVVQNDKLPRVTVSIQLDVDPVLEGEMAGYTEIFGSLLMGGTLSRPKEELDEAIDFIGARISTSSNSVFGTALSHQKDKLFELLADVTLNPAFDEAEFERLKRQKLSELASQKDDPSEIASNVRRSLIYGKDHPYGEVVTEETVNNITLDACEEYYHTYFRPNVGYVAIVGDITLREARRLMRRNFNAWEKRDVPKHQYEIKDRPESNHIAIVNRPNAVQTQLNVSYAVDLKVNSEDVIPARLMNILLGGGSFRLFENLRETYAYTYGAYSSLRSDQVAGNFNAFASVRNEVTDSSVYQILYEMNRIRNERITQKELDLIRNYLTGNFAISLENPQTVARFAINTEMFDLGEDYYANYLRKIEAVGKDDIQRMAQKYIHPENAYIVAVGNASEYAESLRQFNPESVIHYYDIYGNPTDAPAEIELPADATYEKVLDHYIEAIGGEEKLKALKSTKLEMSAEIQGNVISFTEYRQAPAKMYQEVKAGGMTLSKTIFNGTEGSLEQQGQRSMLEGDELSDMKVEALFHSELALKTSDEIEIELVRAEYVNELPVYVLRYTYPSGKVSYHYFDMESGLKLRESVTHEGPGGEDFVQLTEYLSYKEVDGLKFPEKIGQSFGPQVINLKLENIELNPEIDASIFEVN